ncbi:hypothetical protein [Lysinibacillus sp. NPDC056232]
MTERTIEVTERIRDDGKIHLSDEKTCQSEGKPPQTNGKRR